MGTTSLNPPPGLWVRSWQDNEEKAHCLELKTFPACGLSGHQESLPIALGLLQTPPRPQVALTLPRQSSLVKSQGDRFQSSQQWLWVAVALAEAAEGSIWQGCCGWRDLGRQMGQGGLKAVSRLDSTGAG